MVVVIVLARRLGPASFGLFVFVQWLIEMTSLVCSAGLPGAATRFFPQTAGPGPVQMPGLDRWFFRWAAIAVMLTGSVATLCAVAFSSLGTAAQLGAVAFWAASSAALALLGARAQGLFQFKRYAASSALFVAVALVGLALPRLGNDLVAAMVCFGAANLAAAAGCAIDLLSAGRIKSDACLTKCDTHVIWPYAANAWLTSVAASFVWARGEILVVKGQLGESAVGFYSVGLTLAGVVNQGVALLTGGLWPQIASGWDNGDRDGVLRLSSLVTNVLMLAAGLSSGFVICFGPYLVTLLFGKAFIQSADLVLILALGPLGLVSGCAHLVLQAATNGRFARNVTFAGGLSLFGVALLLVPHFGIGGAAVARSATQIAVAVVTLFWVGQVVGHNAETRQNLRSFLLVVTIAVALVIILTLQPNLQIAGRALLFGVYCCFVSLLCVRPKDAGGLRQLRSLVGGGHA
jgi:O-antigen/teichoic acid export membrane protein